MIVCDYIVMNKLSIRTKITDLCCVDNKDNNHFCHKDYVDEFFKKDVINKMLDDHHNDIKPNTRKIFTIYCFLVWYERYFILEK